MWKRRVRGPWRRRRGPGEGQAPFKGSDVYEGVCGLTVAYYVGEAVTPVPLGAGAVDTFKALVFQVVHEGCHEGPIGQDRDGGGQDPDQTKAGARGIDGGLRGQDRGVHKGPPPRLIVRPRCVVRPVDIEPDGVGEDGPVTEGPQGRKVQAGLFLLAGHEVAHGVGVGGVVGGQGLD